MGLFSRQFKGDPKLEACLVQDSAHVTLQAVGDHVAKLQLVMLMLDGAKIDRQESALKRYGPSTAAAVLAYKTKRNIINHAYQSKPDNIVGKMTIASLDREMLEYERRLREHNSCSGKKSHPVFR